MRSRVLFVTLTNDVGSERIVSEMGRHGAACAVLGPSGAFAALVRCVTMQFPISKTFGALGASFVFSRTLAAAVAHWRPDRVVPLDDLSATLLRTIGLDPRSSSAVRRLITRSLGSRHGYDAACHRVAFMEAAARAGVRTPAFQAADTAGPLSLPVMVKRDQSSGSGGVVRVDSAEDRAAALRSARLKTAAKATLARLAGFRHPITPVLLQEVVTGRLAMYTVACQHGRVIDGIGFEAVETHPEKKASTILRRLIHDEMQRSAGTLVAALECSGFVSFDFILDEAGRAFLIEMNPRPIGSTHLGRLFGHDLVYAALTGERCAKRNTVLHDDTAIALFPKELERDPGSPYLLTGARTLHDLPASEPALVAAYMGHLKTLHPTRSTDIERHVPQVSPLPSWTLPPSGTTEPC